MYGFDHKMPTFAIPKFHYLPPMQDYLVYTFTLTPSTEDAMEILIALLGDMGFEGFQQTDRALLAYIPRGLDEAPAVREMADSFPLRGVRLDWSSAPLVPRDWNALWEAEGFRPIEIEGLCLICKPGQEAARGPHDYTLFIEPRMAFGSGSHATTRALVARLLATPLAPLRCLDMGCGTGILSICMAKRGASQIMAIDIDPLCVENTRHNLAINAVTGVDVRLGDATAIEGEFDVIVANIHRNIICHDMPTYARHLAPGGCLIVSGFFCEDFPAVREAAAREGLACTLLHSAPDGEAQWAVATFKQPALRCS